MPSSLALGTPYHICLHYHSKFIVNIKLDSWFCPVYRFESMHNDTYPSLWYHIEYFYYPKRKPCVSSIQSCPIPLTSWQPLIFHYLYGFTFSRKSYNLNHIVCTLFIWFFTQQYAFEVLSCLFISLIAHLFLSLNNIPLYGCIMVYPFTY